MLHVSDPQADSHGYMPAPTAHNPARRDGERNPLTRGDALRVLILCLALPASSPFVAGCAEQSARSQTGDAVRPAARQEARQELSASTAPALDEVWAGDIFTDDEELTYRGYTVRKRSKRVRLDVPPETEPIWGEGDYVVLERAGKVVANFDAGMYTPMGNATSFGLFPLLGGGEKQLIVSQDISRGGNQWIVSLSPRARVIYDGDEYKAGREGNDMGIVDLDRDGVYEITQPVTRFYGFMGWKLAPARTPLPTVIFKYDQKAQTYLPANALFRDYLLKDVAAARERLTGPDDHINHLADVLNIVLGYIFAGDEEGAWAFYEGAYNLPDKAEVKKEIEAELKDDPVYRFMYKRAAKR
jgi:hypothetical protein